MTIPRHVVEKIRDQTDIVALISKDVCLHDFDDHHTGPCPFHSGNDAAHIGTDLNVIGDKRVYHCFGCDDSGDVFKYVMKTKNLPFIDAVRELGTACGVFGGGR